MLLEIGSCLSRLLNVVVFGGKADWSTSARAYRDRADPKWARIVRMIDFVFGAGHCERWYRSEIERGRGNSAAHESITGIEKGAAQ